MVYCRPSNWEGMRYPLGCKDGGHCHDVNACCNAAVFHVVMLNRHLRQSCHWLSGYRPCSFDAWPPMNHAGHTNLGAQGQPWRHAGRGGGRKKFETLILCSGLHHIGKLRYGGYAVQHLSSGSHENLELKRLVPPGPQLVSACLPAVSTVGQRNLTKSALVSYIQVWLLNKPPDFRAQ